MRLLAVAGMAASVATVMPATPAAAAGDDYSIDFVAAAPETYNHNVRVAAQAPPDYQEVGGGAYDDRSVGVDKDIVESLEGGQFECFDTVTYLVAIDNILDPNLTNPSADPETLEFQFSFLADTTGQSGVAISEVTKVEINYVPDMNPPDVDDDGQPEPEDVFIVDPSYPSDPALAKPVNPGGTLTAPLFTQGSELHSTIRVSNIHPGDDVVLRVDVLLACQIGSRPTGNLQAQLNSIYVVTEVDGEEVYEVVPGGEQTVPFKQFRDIYVPDFDDDPLSDNWNDRCEYVGTLVPPDEERGDCPELFEDSSTSTTTADAPTGGSVTGDGSGTASGRFVQSFAGPSAAGISGLAQPREGAQSFGESPRANVVLSPAELPATGSSSTIGFLQIAALLVTAGIAGLVTSHRTRLRHSRRT